jgi:cyclase
VDLVRSDPAGFEVRVDGGQRALSGSARERLVMLQEKPIGDLYLNSIDRDGTGQGYNLDVLDLLPKDFGVPVILAGGAGNTNHFESGLRDDRVDAVATAHLLNFVGDGLHKARENLIARGVHLPVRDIDIRDLRANTMQS